VCGFHARSGAEATPRRTHRGAQPQACSNRIPRCATHIRHGSRSCPG
jgi:hypothetical protein